MKYLRWIGVDDWRDFVFLVLTTITGIMVLTPWLTLNTGDFRVEYSLLHVTEKSAYGQEATVSYSQMVLMDTQGLGGIDTKIARYFSDRMVIYWSLLAGAYVSAVLYYKKGGKMFLISGTALALLTLLWFYNSYTITHRFNLVHTPSDLIQGGKLKTVIIPPFPAVVETKLDLAWEAGASGTVLSLVTGVISVMQDRKKRM